MATRGVRIGPIGEYVSPADLCAEEIQLYDDVGNKVGPPWKVDETDQALYPDQAASPGIGTLEKPVSYITIGSEHSGGADGALLQKEQTDGGGLILIAVKDLDPGEPIVPPLIGNAYLELNGSAVLVASGGLWLEVAQDLGSYVQPLVIEYDKIDSKTIDPMSSLSDRYILYFAGGNERNSCGGEFERFYRARLSEDQTREIHAAADSRTALPIPVTFTLDRDPGRSYSFGTFGLTEAA